MTFNLRSLALYLFALISCFQGCTCSNELLPVRTNEQLPNDPSAEVRYRQDEILIMYKGIPTPGKRDSIRQALLDAGIDTTAVTIRTCNSCNAYVELWQGAEIHTVIHGEGIRAGTVSGGSKGVGEDSLARYSLNFRQPLPVDDLPDLANIRLNDRRPPVSGVDRDTIIIAVLDTGVDTTRVVPSRYLWRNRHELLSSTPDPDGNCYEGDTFGWNFVDNSADIREDNNNLHGTLIADFILREFRGTSANFPQIMVLKTHDSQGRGDLFTSICAMHYALDKGANIINASWGFYYYQEDPHAYLDSLITKVMRSRGVAFVTAAGNKIPEVDALAQAKYQEQYGTPLPERQLRNLEVHNFFPACLAEANNNVFVATTSTNRTTSPTQNFSELFVDFGVLADTVGQGYMKFQIPFSAQPLFISGSSFATAILAGKIAALTRKSEYQPELNKQQVINNIRSGTPAAIRTSAILRARNLVRDGRYVKPQ